MIRLGRLTGLPVVSGGHTIGHVEQSILTRDGLHLRGLTVRHGFGSARWIPAHAISVIGDVAIIIDGKPCRAPKDCTFTLTIVWDSAGLLLGRVTDVYIGHGSHAVQALEISLGPIETLRYGRCIARSFTVSAITTDTGHVMIPCGCTLERTIGTEVKQ